MSDEATAADGARTARLPRPDRPWIFRTYAGHSSAAASNRLYRANLARGQTGLSVAFDLPTQTGYDPDHPLARGEVGRVGVPVAHLGDLRRLFDGIPLAEMNTSMTINATAPWLLALYVALADEQGADRARLQGTTQNDILKEYLSRGTYVFPPGPSLALMTDVVTWSFRNLPRWNPTNVCSYHLQEAGATPVQELAYALSTAVALLDAVAASGAIAPEAFDGLVGRISFFVNAGMDFVTEMAKMRAFARLWDEILVDRYGVADPAARRFRYGVQVNSLGLTEQQPENNVARILIEMLAVTLSRDARARAVQLPAWNEALGLPRPFDQQWSLRLQQILAEETDLLAYPDLFEGSVVVERIVAELTAAARAEMTTIAALGGAVAAVESGEMKRRLVAANAARLAAIESGRRAVVGVNRHVDTAPSPLAGAADVVETVSADAEQAAIAALAAWRAGRDGDAVRRALAGLETAARGGGSIMDASIVAAKAGVTTGEWTACLRAVYGEYRAPTGVDTTAAAATDDADTDADGRPRFAALRVEADRLAALRGRPVTLLVAKPGLDGHSNGAEQIATRAQAAGFAVVYDGIRQTPETIAAAAAARRVDLVGLSILSGAHLTLVADVLAALRRHGVRAPVVVGGIIPADDAERLRAMGVAAVFTPKDFRLDDILAGLLALVDPARPNRAEPTEERDGTTRDA
jgi:(2R)-ethylmalonyl-CoA mutase